MLDETDLNDEKEKPAGSITGSYHDLQQLENEENKEESTDIFDETIESLQQMPPEVGWYRVKVTDTAIIAIVFLYFIFNKPLFCVNSLIFIIPSRKKIVNTSFDFEITR